MSQIVSSSLVLLMFVVAAMPAVAQEATATLTASPAAEPENRAISFYPVETGEGTFITVELEPGSSTEVNVVLGNSGNVDQSIRTYAVPVLTGNNGGLVLADYGTEADATTSWLDYPEQEFNFKPTEGLILSVVVSVPEDIGPGEYVTSLAAEQSGAFEVPGTDMFTQRIRWAVPILIVVPGERQPNFELGEAQLEWYEGSLYATVGVTNTGNVTVRPHGQVRLLDSDGTVIGVSDIAMESVYTNTDAQFIAAWPGIPPSDTYSLEVVLTAEDGEISMDREYSELVPLEQGSSTDEVVPPLSFAPVELVPLTKDNPPTTLQLNAEITNNAEPIENARVSIVTYKDGVEVDRYPILQAVTIEQGTTPVEARYSLPGGFTDGTYTFEVTIEIGDAGTQTVLVTQPIDYEVVVGD